MDFVSFEKLYCRIHECKKELQSSIFFTTMMKKMEYLQILKTLMANYTQNNSTYLSSQVKVDVIVYGLGSIDKKNKSQFQLALILLLKEQHNCIGEIYVYDPIFSELEYNVMTTFGCTRIKYNEEGRRQASKPTIFYMPKCSLDLMNNVLEANIKPWSLGWMTILGNSIKTFCDIFHLSMCYGDFMYLNAIQKYCIEYDVEWPAYSLSATWHLFPKEEAIEFIYLKEREEFECSLAHLLDRKCNRTYLFEGQGRIHLTRGSKTF